LEHGCGFAFGPEKALAGHTWPERPGSLPDLILDSRARKHLHVSIAYEVLFALNKKPLT
jgi:hypothetical protein